MSANIETIAYAGETPWHGLGTKIEPNLTPDEMLTVAGLNWTVNRQPLWTSPDQNAMNKVDDFFALVRDKDNAVLGLCGNRFVPTQNKDAFTFFDKFIKAGKMQMHTAGSLNNGKFVWALAKVNEGFMLPGRDHVESYMLLSSPHVWGESLKVMFTPIRVVCQNTLTMALNGFNTETSFRMMHTRTFDNNAIFAEAEASLGMVDKQLKIYQNQAELLSSVQFRTENELLKYMRSVLEPQSPANEDVPYEDLRMKTKNVLDLLDSQPGGHLESSKGTYWGAYNAITYWADHEAGRNRDTALTSAWFGPNAALKRRALSEAVRFAQAA